MRTYDVMLNSVNKLTISGESLVEAIENNSEKVFHLSGVGNAAGWVLERVWMAYEDGILGGQGGAVLHIVGYGSDALVNYDPTNDPPKETTPLWISGVQKDELPEPYEFAIAKEKNELFDPFADMSSKAPDFIFGVLCGIIDEIGDYHCVLHPDFQVTKNLILSANLTTVNLHQFIGLALQRLAAYRPKSDKGTSRLQKRVAELTELLSTVDKLHPLNSSWISYYKTATYFAEASTVTALSYYREKAGKTQRQLADEVGISLRQEQNYESMTSRLGDAKYSVVEKIAMAVGTSPDKLVKNGVTVRLPRKKTGEQEGTVDM